MSENKSGLKKFQFCRLLFLWKRNDVDFCVFRCMPVVEECTLVLFTMFSLCQTMTTTAPHIHASSHPTESGMIPTLDIQFTWTKTNFLYHHHHAQVERRNPRTVAFVVTPGWWWPTPQKNFQQTILRQSHNHSPPDWQTPSVDCHCWFETDQKKECPETCWFGFRRPLWDFLDWHEEVVSIVASDIVVPEKQLRERPKTKAWAILLP